MGETCKLVCIDDYEEYCKLHMATKVYSYFSRGSRKEATRFSNQNAFRKILFSPRHFVDVSTLVLQRNICTTNEIVAFPVGIAPTSWHTLATPDGELATVRAANNMNIVHISSLDSTTGMKDIAQDKPNAMRWQQIYMCEDKAFMVDFLSKMKVAGVTAVVLTINKPGLTSDSPYMPNHPGGKVMHYFKHKK